MEEIVFMCNRCGDGFSLDEAGRIYEDGQPVTTCPNCGSTDIEEGKRCKICREIHYDFDLKSSGVCKGCFQDAVDSYKSCLRSLMGWEQEVLEDEYGEIDITERDD